MMGKCFEKVSFLLNLCYIFFNFQPTTTHNFQIGFASPSEDSYACNVRKALKCYALGVEFLFAQQQQSQSGQWAAKTIVEAIENESSANEGLAMRMLLQRNEEEEEEEEVNSESATEKGRFLLPHNFVVGGNTDQLGGSKNGGIEIFHRFLSLRCKIMIRAASSYPEQGDGDGGDGDGDTESDDDMDDDDDDDDDEAAKMSVDKGADAELSRQVSERANERTSGQLLTLGAARGVARKGGSRSFTTLRRDGIPDPEADLDTTN